MRLTRAAARAAEAVGRSDDWKRSTTPPKGGAGAELAREATGSQWQEAREDGGMVVGAESIFNGASQPPQHETVLGRQPGTPGQPQRLFANGDASNSPIMVGGEVANTPDPLQEVGVQLTRCSSWRCTFGEMMEGQVEEEEGHETGVHGTQSASSCGPSNTGHSASELITY